LPERASTARTTFMLPMKYSTPSTTSGVDTSPRSFGSSTNHSGRRRLTVRSLI
jgi:hypothetical protein